MVDKASIAERHKKHGGAFDRGSADSYYRRKRSPHIWPDGTMHGEMIPEEKMTEEEIAAYHAGFDWNEELGDYKDWG